MSHSNIRVSVVLAALLPLSALAVAQTQTGKLRADNGAPGDSFGESVALSGGRGLVGAPGAESAYLFDAATSLQQLQLTASDGALEDAFGRSVALDGTLAIVGARGDDDQGPWSGSAYVFDVTTGAQLFKLTPMDGAAGHFFGHAVAISGDRAIVGAPHADGPVAGSGAAYLFDLTTGNQLFKLVASDGGTADFFGGAVAIDADRAIAGAQYNDGVNHEAGAAYVYGVATGTELLKLTPSDASYRREFGTNVAMDGDWAIIGTPYDDSVPNGAAYVFHLPTGTEWMRLHPADGLHFQAFGSSVALSGRRALVGAREDGGPGSELGAAYLFDFTTGRQLAKLYAGDGAHNDNYGDCVAIEGDLAIAGAPRNDASGSAYVVDTDRVGSAFCASTPNSTGEVTGLEASGTTVALDDEVTLRAFGMPLHQNVFFIVSDSAAPKPVPAPFGGGLLCIGRAIGRMYRSPTGASLIGNSGSAGEFSISTTAGDWSTQQIPGPSGATYAALRGTSSYFQAWHRDVHPTCPCLSWSGLSDGLWITWL